MLNDPTFWVATAFLAFIMLLIALNIPATVALKLDSRARKIKEDLDQAEALVREAQDLLSAYQKKQRDAGNEAGAMALNAQKEAENILENGRKKLEDNLNRRQELVLARIQQAEKTALEKIKLRTADIAIDSAHRILKTSLLSDKVDEMTDNSIKTLSKHFQ